MIENFSQVKILWIVDVLCQCCRSVYFNPLLVLFEQNILFFPLFSHSLFTVYTYCSVNNYMHVYIVSIMLKFDICALKNNYLSLSLSGSKKRARWLQARRLFSPTCPNLRIPNRFLREGSKTSGQEVCDGLKNKKITKSKLNFSHRTLHPACPQWTPLCRGQRQPVRVRRLQPWLWGGGRVRERGLPSFQGTLAVSFRHSHLAAGSHRRLYAHRAGIYVR